MKSYSIGDAARHSGVKVPTIRYYESIGLVPAPPRAGNDRRLFDHAALERLSFIRYARGMGFEINEIAVLLSLRDNPHQPCAKVDEIARSRLSDIEERIRQLRALRAELKIMIESCASERVDNCRVIESLSERCRN
jgi:DNA-binding transcriptional MerR regulator